MPSTIDTSTRAREWALENLRAKILRFAHKNCITHLLQARCLDVLGVPSIHRAELHELEAINGMLQALTLYR